MSRHIPGIADTAEPCLRSYVLRKDTGACIHCAKHAAARSLTRRRPSPCLETRCTYVPASSVGGQVQPEDGRVVSRVSAAGQVQLCVRWTADLESAYRHQAAVARAASYRLVICAAPGEAAVRCRPCQLARCSGPSWFSGRRACCPLDLCELSGSCQDGRTSAAEVVCLSARAGPASRRVTCLRAPPRSGAACGGSHLPCCLPRAPSRRRGMPPSRRKLWFPQSYNSRSAPAVLVCER